MRHVSVQNPILFLFAATLVVGCADSALGPLHPHDELDFPVGVTADPAGDTLWVTSGNFDLAYQGGAVLGINVATHDYRPGAAAEIGSYPGSPLLLERGGQAEQLYATSRERNALYHLQIDRSSGSPVLKCEDGTTTSTTTPTTLRCPDDEAVTANQVSSGGNTADLTVGADPFGGMVRLARSQVEKDLILTSAMADGNVASYTLDSSGKPELIGNIGVEAGVYALAHNPTTERIYTTTKFFNIFQVLTLDFHDNDRTANPYTNLVSTISIPATGIIDHARSMVLNADGTRLFATYRSPASVVVVDVSGGPTGSAADRVLSKIPVGRRPSDIRYVPGDASLGIPELLYVSCFSDNRIDVIDPAVGMIIASIDTGHGPFGMDVVTTGTLRRLYVAHFYDHSVGVVELDPRSAYFHTMVAEIR